MHVTVFEYLWENICSDLNKHKGKKYQCKSCDKEYTDSSALWTDNKSVHEGVTYTGCPKIKLALGYLTIVSTSDSQEHFRGPNRF